MFVGDDEKVAIRSNVILEIKSKIYLGLNFELNVVFFFKRAITTLTVRKVPFSQINVIYLTQLFRTS